MIENQHPVRPFIARWHDAQLPGLHAQLDRLATQLGSPDPHTRELARERLAAIRRHVDRIESGQD